MATPNVDAEVTVTLRMTIEEFICVNRRLGSFSFGLAIVQPLCVRRAWRRAYYDTPGANEPTTYVISARGIATTHRLGDSRIEWEAIVKVVESKSDFLFYGAPGVVDLFIPKTAFATREDVHNLRQVLTLAIAERAKLRND